MPTTQLVYLHVQRFADLDPLRCERLTRHVTTADLTTMARHPGSRQRQMLSRGLLREQLGLAAGCAPTDLEFARTPQGKPFLQNADISFNISHSDAACALAWTAGTLPLGVDIEDISRDFHEARLAEHAFSPGEIRAWQGASHPRRRWLCIWTRKEALLKTTGLGIRIGLATIDTEKGDPPGCFNHLRLGNMQYRSWVASEQVFSLAWTAQAGLDVRVRLTGTLPGFEPEPG